MQLSTHEALAVERFTVSVTIPLLYEGGVGTYLRGTGTLFEIDGRPFVVTARHLFDKDDGEPEPPDPARFAFPERPMRGGLHTFGDFNLFRPLEEHIDIAVMELRCAATISKLKSGWQFLSVANVASPSKVTDDGAFFLAGYPTALTKPVNDWLRGVLATAYTQRLPEVPLEAKAPVVPLLDLFFDYGKEATSLAGKTVLTPDLPGASGASVWEHRGVAKGELWSAEAATRVVGVQSATVHSKYFRAKSWFAVALALQQIDRGLAAAVHSKLDTL